MMDRQLTHMVRLIDDLLDVSRITSDKLTLRKERVLLQAIAQNAVEASRPFIEASGHDLELSLPNEPIWLEADPTRLAQVVSNLLTNAAKYTPEGGSIELAAERDGAEIVIRVTDTGLGIPPEMLAEVFEMFTQVNRTLDRAREDLGSGSHWSSGWSNCTVGRFLPRAPASAQGSTFTVRLPHIEASTLVVQPRATSGPAGLDAGVVGPPRAGGRRQCRRGREPGPDVANLRTRCPDGS